MPDPLLIYERAYRIALTTLIPCIGRKFILKDRYLIKTKYNSELRRTAGLRTVVAGMKSVLPLNYHKFRCDLDSSRLNRRPNNNHQFLQFPIIIFPILILGSIAGAPSWFYKRMSAFIKNLKRSDSLWISENLTVRQTLFASFYHARVGHTEEVLIRFTSLIDPRYVNPRLAPGVYPFVSNVAFPIRYPTESQPDHVCLCNVVLTSAPHDRTF